MSKAFLLSEKERLLADLVLTYSLFETWLIFCVEVSSCWRKGEEKGEGLPYPKELGISTLIP
jgi:hypothetical protein